jgi:hypothetical protein
VKLFEVITIRELSICVVVVAGLLDDGLQHSPLDYTPTPHRTVVSELLPANASTLAPGNGFDRRLKRRICSDTCVGLPSVIADGVEMSITLVFVQGVGGYVSERRWAAN